MIAGIKKMRQVPIALALFSIILLLGYDYHKVYAEVTAIDFVYQFANNEIFYMETFQYYVALQRQTSGSTTLTLLHGATETPQLDASQSNNQIVLRPQQFGCTDALGSNPCSASSGSANCNPTTFGPNCGDKLGVTGVWGGLWCGLTDCFVLWKQSTGGYSSQLLRVNMGSEQISGYMNITGTWLVDPYLWGYDESTGGIGGITLFFTKSTDTTSIADIHFVGGTSLMGIVATSGTNICAQSGCAGGGADNRITDISGCRHCGGSPTTTRIFVSSTQSAAQTFNRLITIFNDSAGQHCGATQSSLATAQSVLGTGKVEYLGNDHNSFVMGTSTEVLEIALNCAVTTEYTYASQGLVNYVKGVAVDIDDNVYYLHHGSTATKASVTKMNSTSFNTSVNFDPTVGKTITGWVDGSFTGSQIATASDDDEGLNNDFSTDDWNTLLLLDNTAKARIIYPDGFVPPEPPIGGEICFVIQGTGQTVCYPTDEDGNPIVGSVVEIVAVQNPLVVVVGQYMCQLGVQTDCTDGLPTNNNPETNGVGYILWLATFSIFGAITGSALFGKVKLVENIMFIMVILFITTALSVILNWIPERDLFILIFIVIGFASLASTRFVLGHRSRGGGSD